jgi:hypothetical protein
MSRRRSSALIALTALAGAGAISVAGAAIAGSANAAKPSTHRTHLTIHAAKSHPAPKRHDPFTVHLASGKQGVAGEGANLSLWERTLKPSGHGTDWTDVTSAGTVTDNGDGSYAITGITPNDPAPKSGHKDQFQVRFAGDSTYHASRSSVITIVVKPAS